VAETAPAPSPAEVLALLPQQEPFRFVDEILEVDEDHIVSRYTFRPQADFYRGHFPGNPITPGVLLIEAMAQTGVVALGIYLVGRERGLEDVRRVLTVFTDVTAEFSGVVRPGDTVTIRARKVFFRRMKLRAEVEMRKADGSIVATATLAGMGIAAAAGEAAPHGGRS
jgi:3-hydroxyacyl-[acyl-carrier-protein] dehydratase